MAETRVLNITTMPDKTQCARCKKVGFVRFETIVERGRSRRAYYCGACDYSWNVADDGRATDSKDPDRPDRSRPHGKGETV